VSHCKVCNNCVREFDHHCTILNSCVGYGNIRPFITMLIVESLFALGMAAIGVIFLLYEPYHEQKESAREQGIRFQMNSELILNLSVFIICSIKFVFFICCRSRI
jgi:hypothetical protein